MGLKMPSAYIQNTPEENFTNMDEPRKENALDGFLGNNNKAILKGIAFTYSDCYGYYLLINKIINTSSAKP